MIEFQGIPEIYVDGIKRFIDCHNGNVRIEHARRRFNEDGTVELEVVFVTIMPIAAIADAVGKRQAALGKTSTWPSPDGPESNLNSRTCAAGVH